MVAYGAQHAEQHAEHEATDWVLREQDVALCLVLWDVECVTLEATDATLVISQQLLSNSPAR